MPFYALATIPLLQRLSAGVEQVWYADDVCACGRLGALREWWNHHCELGPSLGYFINVAKTWLVTKSHVQQDTLLSFRGSKSKSQVKAVPIGGSYWF